MPYSPSQITQSMDSLLASKKWQAALSTLVDTSEKQLAKEWLQAVNQAFAAHPMIPLLLGEEVFLHERLFDLIVATVRDGHLSIESDTQALIQDFYDDTLQVWERHLIHGDKYDPRDNGFMGTSVWAHPKAKRLLFKIADVAYRSQDVISIGQQTSIKTELIEAIMSIATDDNYLDNEETCLAAANAIFIREVLGPLHGETLPLQKKHGVDRMPRQSLLASDFGIIRQMNQEELNTALPVISEGANPSIVFMPTYDRLSSNVEDFREIMALFLKTQLANEKVKHIFIPCGDHTHWQAIYIKKEVNALKLYLFDSFGKAQALASLGPEIRRLMTASLTPEEMQSTTMDIQAVNVPYPQGDGIACGYYVVAYAHYLMKQLGVRVATTPLEEGFDGGVAASFEKGQPYIEQSVIALHDNRYSKKRSEVHRPRSNLLQMHFPFFQSLATRQASPMATIKSEKPPSSMSLSQTHVGRALHLRIKKTASSDPLLSRVDIQAVNKEIVRLTRQADRYFTFGAKRKAERLRQAYFSYLGRLEACEVVSPSIVDDENVKAAIDAYRYFGFFYRWKAQWTGVEKKTASRCAIEDALSSDDKKQIIIS